MSVAAFKPRNSQGRELRRGENVKIESKRIGKLFVGGLGVDLTVPILLDALLSTVYLIQGTKNQADSTRC